MFLEWLVKKQPTITWDSKDTKENSEHNSCDVVSGKL